MIDTKPLRDLIEACYTDPPCPISNVRRAEHTLEVMEELLAEHTKDGCEE